MKIHKTKLLFSLLLSWLLFYSGNAFSYSGSGHFLPMTTENGLNNNTVYDFVQGENGFIWLSTDMGISRYDGFHFRNFLYTPQTDASKQLLPQAIRSLHQSSNGILYLQLLEGGIACFDQAKERFLPMTFNMPFEDKTITSLYVADENVLYLATKAGLYHAEIKRAEEDNICLIVSAQPLIEGDMTNLCGDDTGNLFFTLGGKRVIHYSMGTRQTKEVGGSDEMSEVTTLAVTGDYLWIGRRKNNISCYDFKRNLYRTLTNAGENGTSSLSNTYLTGVVAVDKNIFYLSTWAGLYRVNFDSGMLNVVKYTIDCLTDEVKSNKKVEPKMTNLLWDDSQNVLWAGTFGGGAVRVSFNVDVYGRVKQNIGADVTGMVEDAKGYIWLTTAHKGVWKSTGNALSAAITFAAWGKGTRTDGNYKIYKDKNECFWLSDEYSGFLYIDPITEETRQYQLTDSKGQLDVRVRNFCLDSKDRLWVATTDGLLLYDAQMKPKRLMLSDQVKEVYDIAEDKEGTLWIGTDKGLKQGELVLNKLNLIGDYETQVGVKPEAVYSVYVNSYNQVLASYADMIVRIDSRDKEKVETLFTLIDGLSSGHVRCMIDDQNGNTWIGTNSGIMTIRNDKTLFYNYSLTGYCDQVCRLRDGKLLWNDSWGLLFFDPLIVKNRQVRKNLLVSDVWVNGTSMAVGEEVNGQVVLSTAPYTQGEFAFNASNNSFSFYFSDMQYSMIQRKMAYRLLPDEEWKFASLEEGIHYTRLSVGNYRLQVKLIYPDASEGEVLEIPITVNDFWWRTGWAILGYVLLLCGLFGGGYYYIRKRGIKQTPKDRTVSLGLTETDESSQQEGDKLIVDEVRNIILERFMRELRTPLSMIIAPIKEVLQEKELSRGMSTKILVAYRNSIGMLNACDQLLSIYGQNMQNNDRLEVAPYSLVNVVDSFVFSMSEFFSVHPIDFQYEKKIKKEQVVWIDKKKMAFVLHNLLTNAFIHVRYSGAVALLVQETVEEGVPYFTISVVDNSKSEIKILERIRHNRNLIMQIDSAEVELGYEAMEKVLSLHHGSITLENVKGGGTKVQIKCPIDKTVFEGDENVTFISPEAQKEVNLAGTVRRMVAEEELDLTEEEPTIAVVRDKKTLLVVEDYKDIRIYLKTLFEHEYNVLLAENGVEGVEMAKRELPDLVISDVMMPLKDGFQCCKEIKEGLETCHIPVILLTAKVEDDDIVRGLETGADDYILKPFTPKILKAKVRNLIEGRTSLKQMYTQLLAPLGTSNTVSPEGDEKELEIEDPFISTVVKIIEENIQEPDFNVKKLASDLNMSQPTLYRKVKQCTDFTIIELIRGVRMRKAAILLKKKLYPVQEVAEMVGYNDIPTFRKHFVDAYGTTPSTYASSEEKNI